MDTPLDIVLSEFIMLSEIPRPSHHEERISNYLYNWAIEHSLAVERDLSGDVIIDKPASPGNEDKPKIIFQAHMDMVCVSDEAHSYDPLNDPIKVINDGVFLTADGTSLGADDGIGVAICLYILQDSSVSHGPIRVIFTTNEEDGMDSINIDPEYLDGDYLINLDWEKFGSLCNSCAGGDFFSFSHISEWEEPWLGAKSIIVTMNDYLGGHSGVEINKGHANTIVTASTALAMLRQCGIDYRIASFGGGRAKNAIPNFVSVEIVTNEVVRAQELLGQFYSEFTVAFGNIESDGVWNISVSDSLPEKVLSKDLGYSLVELMTVVPNNVHTMSPFADGLVESSSNLGVIDLNSAFVEFIVFARSSVSYQATQLGIICQSLAEKFGFDFRHDGHVPGWAVNPNSKLVSIACDSYRTITGSEMIVESVHAGVECGAFAAKNPHLDMIAIGPTLRDVHTPKESCSCADIKLTIDLIKEILLRLAK